jgi:hypothetical protein
MGGNFHENAVIKVVIVRQILVISHTGADTTNQYPHL